MKRLIKVVLTFLTVASFALSDKILVVVNDDVITESEVMAEAVAMSRIYGQPAYAEQPEFVNHVKEMMVYRILVQGFAQQNKIMFSPEDEANILQTVMENQGKTIEDFDQVAEEAGVESDWMKSFFIYSALQQQIGMMVVGHEVSVSDDALDKLKYEFFEENTQYKLKAWTIDLDNEQAEIQNIKQIKEEWAEGIEPSIGEIQDLGWKFRAELPDVFLAAIEGIEPGNLVGPVQSSFGYHLIWYERENRPEVTDEMILGRAREVQFVEKFNAWLKKLPDYNVVIYKD